MKCLLTHYDWLFSSCFVPSCMNIHRILKEAISVRAVQGISHRKKVFPQTLPDKLSLVASK